MNKAYKVLFANAMQMALSLKSPIIKFFQNGQTGKDYSE